MIDTTDLDSYYPGYDDYCEPKEEQPENPRIDDIIDENKIKESEQNGL